MIKAIVVLMDSVKATLMNDYFSTIGENLMSNTEYTESNTVCR